MDLITGKAKVYFLSYVYGQGLEDLLIRDISLNALIIDWLDSVGIYVETGVYPCEKDGNIYFSGSFFGKLGGWDSGNFFDDRHQATQEAIKKAVEIYNSK